jgi:hypothetical protein
MEIQYGPTVVKGTIPTVDNQSPIDRLISAIQSAMQEPYDYYGDFTQVKITIEIDGAM